MCAGSVEEYRKSLEQLVYNIKLYDGALSNTMMTTIFLLGLKEELCFPVEMQLPDSVAKAVVLASVQERLLQHTKPGGLNKYSNTRPNSYSGKVMVRVPFHQLKCGRLDNSKNIDELMGYASGVEKSLFLVTSALILQPEYQQPSWQLLWHMWVTVVGFSQMIC